MELIPLGPMFAACLAHIYSMFKANVSDVSALKFIYKVLCVMGIFPTGEKSLMGNAQLAVFSIFNVVYLVLMPLEFVKRIGLLHVTIQEVLAFSANQGNLTLLTLICFYGIVTKRESWKLFFEMLDESSKAEYSRDVRVVKKIVVYFVILFVTISINLYQVFTFPENMRRVTATTLLFNVMWIFTYIQALSIVLFAIEVLDVFKNRYNSLNLNIANIFYIKTLDQTQLNKNLQNAKNTIIRLHQNINLLEKVLGKMVFVLLVLAFLSILTLFNFFLFISQNELFSSLLQGVIMSSLLCLELALFVVVLIFSCDKMEKQGEDLIRTLVYIQAKTGDENAVTLVKLLKELRPKFSAAGFFDVNQKIIPTLFSNLSTYLIIILQFKFSQH